MLILLFIIGLFFGSFLGVLVDRISQNRSFLVGRSKCDYCSRVLNFKDLIPVISFLYYRGKCRQCHAKLSIFYPTIEITTAILFALSFYVLTQRFFVFDFKFAAELIYYLIIVSILIVVFFMDIKYRIIANKITMAGILVAILYLFLFNRTEMLNHIVTAGFSFGFFIVIPLLYYLFTKKESMGGGDIKFAFLMGLILGFPSIIAALYIAFLTGALYSIILILWKRISFRNSSIAFGPFLTFSVIITLFWGEIILKTALNYLGI